MTLLLERAEKMPVNANLARVEQMKLEDAIEIKRAFLLNFTQGTLAFIQRNDPDGIESNIKSAIRNLDGLRWLNMPEGREISIPALSKTFNLDFLEKDPEKRHPAYLNFLAEGIRKILNESVKYSPQAVENNSPMQQIVKSLIAPDGQSCYTIEGIVDLFKKNSPTLPLPKRTVQRLSPPSKEDQELITEALISKANIVSEEEPSLDSNVLNKRIAESVGIEEAEVVRILSHFEIGEDGSIVEIKERLRPFKHRKKAPLPY